MIETIVSEAGIGTGIFYQKIKKMLMKELETLQREPELLHKRYQRFRRLGSYRNTEISMSD